MWEDRCGVVECGWEMVEGEGAEFAGDWEILENGGTGPGGGTDRVSGGRKMVENGWEMVEDGGGALGQGMRVGESEE